MDYIYANLTNSLSANDLQKEILNLQGAKQDKLVSGQNIKTINNNSLLGSGNLPIVEGKLQENLVAAIEVGGVDEGTVFPAGTSIEEILRQIFMSNDNYALYWGVCPVIPAKINNKFISEPISEHFQEDGAAHYFTTQVPGQEEGNYCAFAYPATYGVLSHIYCESFIAADLITNWEKLDVTFAGTNYYLYYQKVPTKDVDAKYTFLF